ncbi:ComF family protein [Arsenicibacter rosenii]|uniref:Phosphoribosyltransferase n=1 Tax=Arsenicibacter rosenii TaxID=1750698 RepID=A0A1S2VFW6_9BACT|nr:ComF family protein [Arsenicibacter rosenii]OIN57175.1 phosphoribosyltransferase [Arsenicibacter rosenii]
MIRLLRQALIDFVDLLLPRSCLACLKTLETSEALLCTSCRLHLPETNLHVVPSVITKFTGKVPVDFSVSYLHFTKGGIAQKLIHQIKYRGKKEAARQLGYWYGKVLKSESDLIRESDLLIGVPLHTSRLKQRGYNQADWIAEGLSEALHIPFSTDLLKRHAFQGSQTKKSKVERWENVRSVFSVAANNRLSGQRVILVDDVLTTGATLEACAHTLLEAGCSSVAVITLAVTK